MQRVRHQPAHALHDPRMSILAEKACGKTVSVSQRAKTGHSLGAMVCGLGFSASGGFTGFAVVGAGTGVGLTALGLAGGVSSAVEGAGFTALGLAVGGVSASAEGAGFTAFGLATGCGSASAGVGAGLTTFGFAGGGVTASTVEGSGFVVFAVGCSVTEGLGEVVDLPAEALDGRGFPATGFGFACEIP